MPRVPLQKLKHRNKEIEEEEVTAEPADTMVGAIAKRIQEAHKERANVAERRKVLLGGDIESDEGNSDENTVDKQQMEDETLEGAVAMESPSK